MGKADVNVNIWLSEKKRFANLFNGVIYGGRQVILPEDLEEVNPVSSVSVKNRTRIRFIMRCRTRRCFMMEWITKHRFGIIGKTLMTDENRTKKQDSRWSILPQENICRDFEKRID